MSLNFPQFSRFFSAKAVHAAFFWTQKTLLWGALIALLAANLFAAPNLSTITTTMLLGVFRQPYEVRPHTALALKLWGLGYEVSAKKELELANYLSKTNPSTGVLGTSTDPQTLLHQWESQPVLLQKQYEYWLDISRNHPDYRDALLAAGNVAYQLGNTKAAKKLWSAASLVDPSNPHIEKLLLLVQ